MTAKLEELEEENKILTFNQGDQLRECSVLKKTGSDWEIYNGHRIIPTQDVTLYMNFINDFRFLIYGALIQQNTTGTTVTTIYRLYPVKFKIIFVTYLRPSDPNITPKNF